ncbi:cytosine-specific methyltransferase [Kitasatospora herbaricolor]|uniref:DNA cytosine methyltransferase n=1 Tax=Kitasatospora herbaricolor TaxID=68217 RepID=UPI00174A49F6|nr:DNA cytosine methyltransferase [Kitasatospora herbaricolor]MDQ0307954.1 DNA (cytosine-5)-methyltransferase 1 [Kitasatospora herbaricolor]GGV39461.1 cytosine-specific methyltransferase [Kitasatospora herbaricolor]
MPTYSAVDLFAGAGGATRGLRDAGFRMLAAVENDPEAAETYRRNHPRVCLFAKDIRAVEPADILAAAGLVPGELDLLKACPPCQGFSSLANGAVDERRNDLVLDTFRFVEALRPKVVLLENVPGLARDSRRPELDRLLTGAGYKLKATVLDAAMFGVPQRRKRFICFALRADVPFLFERDVIDLLPDSFRATPRTARHALDHLARHRRTDDSLDVHRTSSAAVEARIAAIPVGGNRFDLPVEHQLDCHRRLANPRNAASSYGRIKLDEPAPTMTTRCTTPACGTFIHPTKNRGLTLREAATFQTFPVTYRFYGNYGSIERQIGNAVPVRMAKGLGLIATAILNAPLG